MKLSWSKILNLGSAVLSQKGEEVMVVYAETSPAKAKADKTKDKKKKRDRGKIFRRKKDLRRKALVKREEWLPEHEQGRLTVDIYEDEKNNQLIIESIVAGIKAKDIDITVEPDLIIIRGERQKARKKASYRNYCQECFWGKFSRTLVLPCRILPNEVKANLKNGVLTIILSKEEDTERSVKIEE